MSILRASFEHTEVWIIQFILFVLSPPLKNNDICPDLDFFLPEDELLISQLTCDFWVLFCLGWLPDRMAVVRSETGGRFLARGETGSSQVGEDERYDLGV
jgi:hypothetical protein